MPTDAFYQLEEEKKEHLLKTAIHEFSIHSYEKVSVFKIAQNAGISRSNFYYYFKDKEDIYQYLMLQMRLSYIEALEKRGGSRDLFTLAKGIFHEIAKIRDTEKEQFMHQVIDNMKADDVFGFLQRLDECIGVSHKKYLTGLDDLKVQDDRQIAGLIAMLITGTAFSLRKYMSGECSLQEAEERLDEMIDMLRFGVMKSKED